jgi:shikimate kinase
LWQRVRHKATRPLLRTPNPRATLAALYAERVPLYEMADIAVDATPEMSVEQMAARVAEALMAYGDVLDEGVK